MIRKLRYYSNYTVIRWQLLAASAGIYFVYWWTMNQYDWGDVDSPAFVIFSKAFVPVLAWSTIFVFSFAILSALSAWLWFMWRLRKKKIALQLKFGEDVSATAGWVPFTVVLKGALRPFLGTVRGRLIFAGMKLSAPLLLDENVRVRGKFLREGIRGRGETHLNDRGIYDVEEVQLMFCDMLRLISLPCTLPASKQFYTVPMEMKAQTIDAHPNATEEQTQRIPIPKRIEGEFINYKDFESGDDVRRIVWKIYARSGELVVRIPEIRDPYASHLYFYGSFYNPERDMESGIFSNELLNRYKDRLRNILEALKKNGFDVRLPMDQPLQQMSGVSEKGNDLYKISSSNWHTDKTPNEFVEGGKAAFVCVSSLVPVEEVAKMMHNIPMYVPVVAIKMSDAVPSVFRFRFGKLLFAGEEKETDQLKRPWLISPLRMKLKRNELLLQQVFKQRGNAFLLSSGTEE